MKIALFLFLWWAVGFYSFSYWWTKNRDLTVPDAVFGTVMGFMGPVAYLAGWIIEGDHDTKNSSVVFKKRV